VGVAGGAVVERVVGSGSDGAGAAVHDPLHEDAHVGFLEPRDALTAPMAVREEREGVAGDLVEHRVAVAAEQGHGSRQAVVGMVEMDDRRRSGGTRVVNVVVARAVRRVTATGGS
jgi:hypothetical protein